MTNTIASDTLVEAIGRALCAAQGCRESDNELDRCAFEAQAALTAITQAGYAVVPIEPTAPHLRFEEGE